MKKLMFLIIIMILTLPLIYLACDSSDDDDDNNDNDSSINYRQEMRDFVQAISSYTKGINSQFLIITQNGQEILTENR